MTQTESPERIAERIEQAWRDYAGFDCPLPQLRSLIAQAIADDRRRVREECAGIAESKRWQWTLDDHADTHNDACADIASAIRAAGEE